MKKTFIILMLLMGIVLSAQAQNFFNFNKNNQYYGGGLFSRGLVSDEMYYGAYIERHGLFYNNDLPALPGHDLENDQAAPVGSGMLLLFTFGAAYAVAKKHRKE